MTNSELWNILYNDVREAWVEACPIEEEEVAYIGPTVSHAMVQEIWMTEPMDHLGTMVQGDVEMEVYLENPK